MGTSVDQCQTHFKGAYVQKLSNNLLFFSCVHTFEGSIAGTWWSRNVLSTFLLFLQLHLSIWTTKVLISSKESKYLRWEPSWGEQPVLRRVRELWLKVCSGLQPPGQQFSKVWVCLQNNRTMVQSTLATMSTLHTKSFWSFGTFQSQTFETTSCWVENDKFQLWTKTVWKLQMWTSVSCPRSLVIMATLTSLCSVTLQEVWGCPSKISMKTWLNAVNKIHDQKLYWWNQFGSFLMFHLNVFLF